MSKMASSLAHWKPIATEYDPLKAGSIDGTDEEPHDHGIVRAMNATYRPNKGVIDSLHCVMRNQVTRERFYNDRISLPNSVLEDLPAQFVDWTKVFNCYPLPTFNSLVKMYKITTDNTVCSVNGEGRPECTLFVGRLHHVTTEDSISDAFSRYGPIVRVRLVTDIITGFSKCYGFIEFENQCDAQRALRDSSRIVIDDKDVFIDFECERTLKGWIPRRLGGGFGGRKESGQLRFGGTDRPFRKPILLETKVEKNKSYDSKYEHFQSNEDRDSLRERSRGRKYLDRDSPSDSRRSHHRRRRSRSQDRTARSSRVQRSPNKYKRRSRSRSRERHSKTSRSGRY